MENLKWPSRRVVSFKHIEHAFWWGTMKMLYNKVNGICIDYGTCLELVLNIIV